MAFAILAVGVSAVVTDVYQIARRHAWTVPVVWVGIHGVILVTGVLSLRKSEGAGATPSPVPSAA